MDDTARRVQLGFRVIAMLVLDRLSPVLGMNPEHWLNNPHFGACPPQLETIESGEYTSVLSYGGTLYRVTIDLFRINTMTVSTIVVGYEMVGVATLQDRMMGELALDCLDAMTSIGFRIFVDS